MGGNIDCYLDLSSFYSYLTLVYLERNRSKLEDQDVTINYIPFFLGGVNVGSGNKPPWSLPAKANYGNYDMARALNYFGVKNVSVPDFFPPLTILPQRALCYIKHHHPSSTLAQAWLALFEAMWTSPHQNITQAPILASVLAATKLFSATQVNEIMAGATAQRWKDALTANTQTALAQGAFGAPWMWARDGKGKEEPFFGSDRWHFLWEFLGVGWRDLEVVPRGKGGREGKL